jgi:hypothetical protein
MSSPSRDLSLAMRRALPELAAVMTRMAAKINRALEQFSTITERLPEVEGRIQERRAVERYNATIERERQTGLTFVKALGVQARFELGLPLCEPPKYRQS